MVAKTRGSNCYLEFISNSNVTDSSTFWRHNLSIIFFRTFRTNTNRTDHCSVRVRLEQKFLQPLLVRFEPNKNRTGGLFGSATLEQCLCSVRDRTEQTEQTRTCTVRQAISVSNTTTTNCSAQNAIIRQFHFYSGATKYYLGFYPRARAAREPTYAGSCSAHARTS